MADLTLKTIQLRGKIRRFIQANLRSRDRGVLLQPRSGECNRCGECCKILYKCPFLRTDAQGQHTCLIYERRFAQCRLFPMHVEDLAEVRECSYRFGFGSFAVVSPAASPKAAEE